MRWTAPQAVEMTKREASLLYSHSFNHKRGNEPETAGPFGPSFLFGNYYIAVATRTTFTLCTPGMKQMGTEEIPRPYSWSPKQRIMRHGTPEVGELGTSVLSVHALQDMAKVQQSVTARLARVIEDGHDRFRATRPTPENTPGLFFDHEYVESRHREWRRSIADTLKLPAPPHTGIGFNGGLLEIVGEVARAAHGTGGTNAVYVAMYGQEERGSVDPSFVIEANGDHGCWFVMVQGLKTVTR